MKRLGIGLIRLYRFVFGWLPSSCRFEPTCSHYTEQAIEKYGLLRDAVAAGRGDAFVFFVKGDAEGFSTSTKVFYTNKAGVKVEDTRRNSLRASMLEGSASWSAVINKYGSFPTNPMDALALNQAK